MSRVNLEHLISEHPESKVALRELEHWLNKRGTTDDITPRELARNVHVEPTALAAALGLLVQAGILRRVYRVQKPNGVMVPGEYDDPRQIPNELKDRREQRIDISDADVVPVFKQQRQVA
jgi:imidazolonepropionase-like amidohydrolase